MPRYPLPILLAAVLLPTTPAFAQAWHPEPSGTSAELRGLSVVDARVAWASGARGTVLRTVDGAHWQAMQVPDAGQIDLRDIQAFDSEHAVAMGAGPGAASRVYRTVDGGKSWQLAATNADADGFWDALAFWDREHGILFGDPVAGRFQVYVTDDGGAHWRALAARGLDALEHEGAFAASGTCLAVAGKDDAWIATGGAGKARVLHSSDHGRTWQASTLAIPAGAPAKGVFSVVFRDTKEGLAVGGDYQNPHLAGVNGARSEDGGASWTEAQVEPVGYMSVVAAVPGAPHSYVAAGLAGSGASRDGGRSWTVLDPTPVNAVGFSGPSSGWAVGPKGLLMKYTGPALDR